MKGVGYLMILKQADNIDENDDKLSGDAKDKLIQEAWKTILNICWN